MEIDDEHEPAIFDGDEPGLPAYKHRNDGKQFRLRVPHSGGVEACSYSTDIFLRTLLLSGCSSFIAEGRRLRGSGALVKISPLLPK